MDNFIRVVLAEDQSIIRQGLRYIIDAQSDMTVVGEATDGEQALQTTMQTAPDLVLMDIRMPRHCEVDLVQHGEPAPPGEYSHTLQLVDVATGWSERLHSWDAVRWRWLRPSRRPWRGSPSH